MRFRNQSGFTLPELITAILALLVFAVVAAFILRPTSFNNQELASDRRLALATLVQAFGRYRDDKGSWPEGLSSSPKQLGTEEGQVNLCDALVPVYLKDIPVDPITGFKLSAETEDLTDEPCTADVIYSSGIYVSVSADGEHITARTAGFKEFPEITISR